MSAGGHRLVDAAGGGDHAVIAPPQPLADLEALLPRLNGDIEITSLVEQRAMHRALAYLLADLSIRLDTAIVEQHPAAEDAVLAYFDYAHVKGVLFRLERLGAQMEAIIEVATGTVADDETAATFLFREPFEGL